MFTSLLGKSEQNPNFGSSKAKLIFNMGWSFPYYFTHTSKYLFLHNSDSLSISHPWETWQKQKEKGKAIEAKKWNQVSGL